MKTCNHCKTEKPLTCFSRNRASKDGLQAHCKDCQRAANRRSYERNKECHQLRYRENHDEIRSRQKRYRLEHREDYKAIADRYRASEIGRAKQLWAAARNRSKRIGVKFDLSLERMKDVIISGSCEKTGLSFDLEPHGEFQNNPFAPSVDRINSFGDYTDENVQIVCVAYNIGKNQMTDEQFVWFCKRVVERNT